MNIYDWDRCDHAGIGQPGCQTCDPDKERVLLRAQHRSEGMDGMAHARECSSRQVSGGRNQVKAIVKAKSEVQRAEKAVVRAALRWVYCDLDSGTTAARRWDLKHACDRLLKARKKAK